MTLRTEIAEIATGLGWCCVDFNETDRSGFAWSCTTNFCGPADSRATVEWSLTGDPLHAFLTTEPGVGTSATSSESGPTVAARTIIDWIRGVGPRIPAWRP